MAATNETYKASLILNGEACLDLQNSKNANPHDCYVDGEPFLTVMPSNKAYLYYFGF